MLDEIFQLLVTLATPIADLILSKEWIEVFNAPIILTILLIFVTSLYSRPFGEIETGAGLRTLD
jgi:hypothetical protein